MIAKSPGVTLLPGTELGGAPTVRIRGVSSISLNNAPIWYVDGVRYSAGSLLSGPTSSFSMLNNINPEDIEDIEIVKGPSAATLYGTNAANGVILITTKKGRAGATHWNWSMEQRNIQDWVPYQDMYANFGHDPVTGKAKRCELSTVATPKFTVAQGADCISDSLTSYNWMKDPENTFVHTGKGSLYGLNITGGTDQVRYFVSSDVDNEQGPIQMPWYDVQRFDSTHVGVRNEWYPSRSAAAGVVPRQPLGVAEPEVRPDRELRLREAGQPHSAGERSDHRALLRRHAELRLQGLSGRCLAAAVSIRFRRRPMACRCTTRCSGIRVTSCRSPRTTTRSASPAA